MAVATLRYFYEEAPHIPVITAGSLLKVYLEKQKTGTMKSLHLFMDSSKSNLGIRLFRDKVSISEIQTPKGKHFRLLNLPYFLGGKLNDYIGNVDSLL